MNRSPVTADVSNTVWIDTPPPVAETERGAPTKSAARSLVSWMGVHEPPLEFERVKAAVAITPFATGASLKPQSTQVTLATP